MAVIDTQNLEHILEGLKGEVVSLNSTFGNLTPALTTISKFNFQQSSNFNSGQGSNNNPLAGNTALQKALASLEDAVKANTEATEKNTAALLGNKDALDNSTRKKTTDTQQQSGEGGGMGGLSSMLKLAALASVATRAISFASKYMDMSQQDHRTAWQTYGQFGSFSNMQQANEYAGSIGQGLGYSREETMKANQQLIKQGGWAGQEANYRDMTAAANTARAYGMDLSSVASQMGSWQKSGILEAGEGEKFGAILTNAIDKSKLTGRNEEVANMLTSHFQRQAAQGFGDEAGKAGSLATMNAILAFGANHKEWAGQAAGNTLMSGIKQFNNMDGMDAIMVGMNPERYGSIDGLIQMRIDKEQNPTEYMNRALDSVRAGNIDADAMKELMLKSNINPKLIQQFSEMLQTGERFENVESLTEGEGKSADAYKDETFAKLDARMVETENILKDFGNTLNEVKNSVQETLVDMLGKEGYAAVVAFNEVLGVAGAVAGIKLFIDALTGAVQFILGDGFLGALKGFLTKLGAENATQAAGSGGVIKKALSGVGNFFGGASGAVLGGFGLALAAGVWSANEDKDLLENKYKGDVKAWAKDKYGEDSDEYQRLLQVEEEQKSRDESVANASQKSIDMANEGKNVLNTEISDFDISIEDMANGTIAAIGQNKDKIHQDYDNWQKATVTAQEQLNQRGKKWAEEHSKGVVDVNTLDTLSYDEETGEVTERKEENVADAIKEQTKESNEATKEVNKTLEDAKELAENIGSKTHELLKTAPSSLLTILKEIKDAVLSLRGVKGFGGSNSPLTGNGDALDQSFKQWEGIRMDNGSNGCVEAVTKIGAGYNSFLSNELKKGTVNVGQLTENAINSGVGVENYTDNTTINRGDVIIYGKKGTDVTNLANKDNLEHVVIADGNGGYVGNSSSLQKVVARDDMTQMSGLDIIGVIRSGSGGVPSNPSAPSVSDFRRMENGDTQKPTNVTPAKPHTVSEPEESKPKSTSTIKPEESKPKSTSTIKPKDDYLSEDKLSVIKDLVKQYKQEGLKPQDLLHRLQNIGGFSEIKTEDLLGEIENQFNPNADNSPEGYAKDLAKKGYSPTQIAHEMANRGVSQDTINTALKAVQSVDTSSIPNKGAPKDVDLQGLSDTLNNPSAMRNLSDTQRKGFETVGATASEVLKAVGGDKDAIETIAEKILEYEKQREEIAKKEVESEEKKAQIAEEASSEDVVSTTDAISNISSSEDVVSTTDAISNISSSEDVVSTTDAISNISSDISSTPIANKITNTESIASKLKKGGLAEEMDALSDIVDEKGNLVSYKGLEDNLVSGKEDLSFVRDKQTAQLKDLDNDTLKKYKSVLEKNKDKTTDPKILSLLQAIETAIKKKEFTANVNNVSPAERIIQGTVSSNPRNGLM